MQRRKKDNENGQEFNKARKYRIYPTEEQKEFLEQQFGCCRLVYNAYLEFRNEDYEAFKWHEMMGEIPKETIIKTNKDGKTVEKSRTAKEYYDLYKECSTPFSIANDLYEDYPFLKDMDSIALGNARRNAETAFENFHKKLSQGMSVEKAGKPKFKSKHKSLPSFTTNRPNTYADKPNSMGNVAMTENGIKIPKLKTPIKAIYHQMPGKDWVLISATISRSGDEYYCSLGFRYNADIKADEKKDDKDKKSIGLHYKQDSLYVDSEGTCANMPRYFERSEKHLADMRRKLSAMQGPNHRKGIEPSNNYKKQLAKIRKLETHVARQRKYYLHCKSKELAETYDLIAVDGYNIRDMASKDNSIDITMNTSEHGEAVKKLRFGKKVNDNGFGMFREMLKYKQEDRGHEYVQIEEYTHNNATCSHCGYVNPLASDTRIKSIKCPNCGMEYNREVNAANNNKKLLAHS